MSGPSLSIPGAEYRPRRNSTPAAKRRLRNRQRRAEHHLDLVLAAVIGQGNDRVSRQHGSVQTDLGDAAADALRIPDGDPVESAAVTVGDLEAFPPSGDARIDAKCGALLPESEDPLQARAVQPARGPGVPSPSPPSHVGRFGINIRGNGVRLDLVLLNLRATLGMAGRVQ